MSHVTCTTSIVPTPCAQCGELTGVAWEEWDDEGVSGRKTNHVTTPLCTSTILHRFHGILSPCRADRNVRPEDVVCQLGPGQIAVQVDGRMVAWNPAEAMLLGHWITDDDVDKTPSPLPPWLVSRGDK